MTARQVQVSQGDLRDALRVASQPDVRSPSRHASRNGHGSGTPSRDAGRYGHARLRDNFRLSTRRFRLSIQHLHADTTAGAEKIYLARMQLQGDLTLHTMLK